MTGVGIRVDLTGKEEALAALRAIVSRVEHPQPMFAQIGASLVTSTQRRFEEGRAPSGNPWPPSMRARLEGGKTLIDTARLMQSITFNASDAGVEVGTNVIYAAAHQLGAVIHMPARTQTTYRHYDARNDELSTKFVKRSKSNFAEDVAVPAHDVRLPARPFLGLDDDDDREILEIAADYVAGAEANP